MRRANSSRGETTALASSVPLGELCCRGAAGRQSIKSSGKMTHAAAADLTSLSTLVFSGGRRST